MEYTEPEKDFPTELSDLSWLDLQALAKYHSRIAENLLLRSKRLRNIDNMNKQVEARVEELEASYKLVLAYLEKGYNSHESAVAAAARDLNLPEFTVMGWWRLFLRKRDQQARAERNEYILRLVKAGYHNYEISARLGVHQNTVSRAIGEYLHGSMRPCDRARLRKRRKIERKEPEAVMPPAPPR